MKRIGGSDPQTRRDPPKAEHAGSPIGGEVVGEAGGQEARVEVEEQQGGTQGAP